MANSEMLNREVFQNDPVNSYLANNGVAKVSEEKNPEALKTLEYELKTFVCDGKYKDCLLYTSPSPRDQRGSRMPSSA